MIPGVNKNNENSQRSEPNRAGGSGKHSEEGGGGGRVNSGALVIA